jgi:hypothetical protein
VSDKMIKHRNIGPALCRLRGFIGFMRGACCFHHAMDSISGSGIEPIGFSLFDWRDWLLLIFLVVVGPFLVIRSSIKVVDCSFHLTNYYNGL